ncbi:MAG: hypothetical protein WB297_06030 [Actinomycetota bacterium]
MNALRAARGEKHGRRAALDHPRKHGSLGPDGIEDHAKVGYARLEVGRRDVPARQPRATAVVEDQPRE